MHVFKGTYEKNITGEITRIDGSHLSWLIDLIMVYPRSKYSVICMPNHTDE